MGIPTKKTLYKFGVEGLRRIFARAVREWLRDDDDDAAKSTLSWPKKKSLSSKQIPHNDYQTWSPRYYGAVSPSC